MPEAAVTAECDYNPVVLHGAQAHHCRAEVNGVVGLYSCDCPVATRSVWPVDGPLVSPWRRPRPCTCWPICCFEVEESSCGCFELEGSTTCFHHDCFPCSSASGCAADAACMTVWPGTRCIKDADPRLPTAPRAGAPTP